MTEHRPVSRVRLWWPVVAVLLMIAWSNIPPYQAHVKDEPRALFVWHWKLYQQGGQQVCDVRYFDMNKGGEPIERWKLFGYERPGEMPDNVARTDHDKLYAAYGQVCKALRKSGDAAPNVEVAARCGVPKGWQQVERRRRNVCAARPKAKQATSGEAAKSGKAGKAGEATKQPQ